MGCDGGSIPKRKEVVKTKQRTTRRQRSKKLEESEKWKFCAISGAFLRKPTIVSSPYGFLLDKQEVLEFLILRSRRSLEYYDRIEDHPDILNCIHRLKDIKELTLKDNPAYDVNKAFSSDNDDTVIGEFVCPITGLETNGQYKFVFPWHCGCVVSERALKEVSNDDKCLLCQKPYKEYDLVYINPTKEELKRNQAAFLVRGMAKHIASEPKPDSDSSTHGSPSKRIESCRYIEPKASSFEPRPTTSASSSNHDPKPGTSSRGGASASRKRCSTAPESTKRLKEA